MLSRMVIALLACGLIAVNGCAPAPPAGFPKVYPCTITVTDGGTGIENVNIQMVPEQALNSIVISSITDSTGVAIVRTRHGSYTVAGAPEGKYTLLLHKNVQVDFPNLTEEEYEAMTERQKQDREREIQRKYRAAQVIPLKLQSPDQSPLRFEVAPSKNEIAIDISEYKK